MPLGPRNQGPNIQSGPRLNPNPAWPFWVQGPPPIVGATGTNIFNQDLTATVNVTSSFGNLILKILSATVNITVSLVKQINKPLTATVNLTVSLIKQVNKT